MRLDIAEEGHIVGGEGDGDESKHERSDEEDALGGHPEVADSYDSNAIRKRKCSFYISIVLFPSLSD